MIVFTMMAVGLNVVVGYAGLLDLGYVAFYAAGAYTAGWLARGHFDAGQLPLPARSAPDGAPGIHISMWLVLHHRRASSRRSSASSSACRRCGCAATTSRSSRSASARSSRSSCGTPTTSAASTSRTAPSGSARSTRSGSAAFVFRDRSRTARELFYWTAVGLAPVHRLLLRPAARLAARPRLDRDPRGRDCRRGDGRPADADEDLVLRDRRLLRRRRRRLLRELQVGRVPGGLLLQLLGLPALHGDPRRDGQRLGRDRRRHDPRLPQHRGARDDRRRRCRRRGLDFDPTKYQFGIYGAIIVADDALPARRA